MCARLAAELQVVSAELAMMEEGEWPLPAELGDAVVERDSMAAAIKELPEAVRARLRTLYKAQMDVRDGREPVSWPAPDSIGVLERRADDALEDVRRARLRDAGLHETIGLSERSW